MMFDVMQANEKNDHDAVASLSSWIERKTPRLRRRLVKVANKPSTALSQDAEVEMSDLVPRPLDPARRRKASRLLCLYFNISTVSGLSL
jgi:hypothetical protein